MTSWGVVLLVGFVALGLSRGRSRVHANAFAAGLTVVVLTFAALKQHTL